MDVVSESSAPVVGPNPDDDVEQTLEKEVERAEKTSESLESSLQESFERQRRLKRDLRRAEDRTIRLKEELEETLKTIREDRRRIMALQAEQSFTAKQIKDALSLDLKQYEATLRSKQPDLYDYCNQATNARDCVVVINSIRLCRRHIQLAEMIIAHRYASYLSEKPSPNAPPPLAHHPLAHPPIGGSGGGQSPVSVQSSPVCPALNSPSSPLSQLLSLPVNQTLPVNQSTSPVNQPMTINQLLAASHQQSAAALQHHPYHHHHHHQQQQQHRIKSEKMKPRRLSLVKVDHKTTTSVAATAAAAMATVAMATSSSSTSSSASSSRPAASVSAAKATGSRDAGTGGSGGGGTARAADVVRIEIRERDSHPAWIATRDIKPIVLSYAGK